MYIATHVIDIQTNNYPTGTTEHTVTNSFPADTSILGVSVETIGGSLDGIVSATYEPSAGTWVDIFSSYFSDSNKSTSSLINPDVFKDYAPISYTVSVVVSHLVEVQSAITVRITYYYESSAKTELIYHESVCSFSFGDDGTAIGTLSQPLYNMEKLLNVSAEVDGSAENLKMTSLFACDNLSETGEENLFGNVYAINILGQYTVMCGVYTPNVEDLLRNHGKIVAKPDDVSYPTQNITVTYKIKYAAHIATIKYYDGSDFSNCNVNYYDGENFIECEPMIYDGTKFVPCSFY